MVKPVAIVLGGTFPHIFLVNELHKRGYYIVLVDYLADPPARIVADEHVQESTLDKDKVLEIATKKKASLVISTCIDQANSVCSYVAERMNLPHPYSYAMSLFFTNKGLMKGRMKEVNIPTPPFFLTKSVTEVDWDEVSFPCVIKPVDCNSSKGVHRADSYDEAKVFLHEALCLSRTGEAVIEDFCEGEEVQVDCVSHENGVDVIMTRSKVKVEDKSASVLNSFGSVVPAQISEKVRSCFQSIAESIANGFGLNNTPFFFQAIVAGDSVSVLEFAPRVGGDLSFFMLKRFAGYDAIEATVDSFLGLPIKAVFHYPEKLYRTCLLYAKPCVFDHIEGLNTLRKEGFIIGSFITKSKGDKIDGDMRSSDRVGAFVVEASSLYELNERVNRCLNRVEIIDDKGHDMSQRY